MISFIRTSRSMNEVNRIQKQMVFISHFSEGRRYGKTVIFAKNTQESSDDEEGNDSDSEDDEEESNSDDDSMDKGHPPKKQKFS